MNWLFLLLQWNISQCITSYNSYENCVHKIICLTFPQDHLLLSILIMMCYNVFMFKKLQKISYLSSTIRNTCILWWHFFPVASQLIQSKFLKQKLFYYLFFFCQYNTIVYFQIINALEELSIWTWKWLNTISLNNIVACPSRSKG